MSSLNDILSKIWAEDGLHRPRLFTANQVASTPAGDAIIYAGLRYEVDKPPVRLLLLDVPRSLATRQGLNKKLDNLVLSSLENSDNFKRAWVSLALLNSEFESIFQVLCLDLIDKICVLPNDIDRLNMFLQRIQVWSSLFSLEAKLGLTKESQRGLFGELCCILALSKNSKAMQDVISSWTGLHGGHQDFRFHKGSIEVKTTKGNGDFIKVDDEYQLDTSNLMSLYLVHVFLNEGIPTAKSLPDLIDEIRFTIISSPAILSIFNDTLIRSGYLDVHISYYESIRYSVRAIQTYKIVDGFPRLESNSLPDGVLDTSYLLRASKLLPFSCTLDEIRSQLII